MKATISKAATTPIMIPPIAPPDNPLSVPLVGDPVPVAVVGWVEVAGGGGKVVVTMAPLILNWFVLTILPAPV